MANFLLILVMMITLKIIRNTPLNCPKERCSSNGQCVDNISLCPVAMSCPNDFLKINQFTCSKEGKFSVPFDCPEDYFICWEGTCTKDPEECPSMATCPSTYSVRCPDNSCVKTLDDCPKYSECPNFIPVRCPNGDCRKNLNDCPKIIRCPKEFTVLCNDGSCRMTSDQCEVPAVQTQCVDQFMSRCSDGSCTSSKFLCPTPKTCPDGNVMCWNGSCAKNYKSCDKPFLSQSNTCSDSSLVRCEMDGSCKNNIQQCATGVICPVEKPVKCWDNSCRENVSKCPAYQGCPEGTTNCSDGSCTTTDCGTHITCSMDSPFKCFDNTCRKNPKDCYTPVDCPNDYPIACWDGNCLKDRADCLPPETCPITEPVKCPNNMCRKTAEECKVTTECPMGFSRCSDGSCRKSLSMCPSLECPKSLPHKCNNGLCVADSKSCDTEKGCPFLKPFRCNDGSCVKDETLCQTSLKCNGTGLQLCQDGSCIPKSQQCPLENGCPIYTPLKCVDGTCIDPKKSSCPVALCPLETPIKCSNGLCVLSYSSCQASLEYNFEECEAKYYPCADGTCAISPDECRPVFKCPIGTERCNDGSCRSSLQLCPLINTCPETRSYRCPDGSCAKTLDYCVNLSGCPMTAQFKCFSSGYCVKNLSECTEIEGLFPKANGCDNNNPVKCSNGKCVSDASQCIRLDICPEGKVYCSNSGTCADRLRDCANYGTKCPENYVRCPKDGRCMPNYEECLNSSSCPIKSPFRCIDGSCKRYPYINSKENFDTKEYCDIGIVCPDFKPYLCADGSCVEKSSFCQSMVQCPDDKIRCFDRTCVDKEEECTTPKKKCPYNTPLLCNVSGKCVDSIFECQDTSCPPSAPFKCTNGLCERSPRNCVINRITHTTVCNNDEVTCHDGSCRKSLEMCPIYPGCTDLKFPFKCPDGSCVISKNDCDANPICEQGTTLCEDGICRKECPSYAGCPNDKPLLCPVGICVNFESECAGISNCPVDTPIRCFDGSCTDKMNKCKNTKRQFIGTDVQLFISKNKSSNTKIALGESNDVIGYLFTDFDTFEVRPEYTQATSKITESELTSTILQIKSIPTAKLKDTKSIINETRAEDVFTIFPYADASNNLLLEYEYGLLSTALHIDFYEPDKYKNSASFLLTLGYDFPDKHPKLLKENKKDASVQTTKILDPLTDVCLAKLDEEKNIWNCVKSASLTSAFANYYLTGDVDIPGIYAVILSPQPNNDIIITPQNFLVKYLVIILISGVSSAILIFIGLYVFVRIYRFKGKYMESREEAKKYEGKMQEMQMIGTSYLGQTIGDNLENIIFTNNPTFKMEKDEIKTQRLEELEQIQDTVLKRFKGLEKNNENLKASFNSITNELKRLMEYKEQLEKNGELEGDIKVEIKSGDEDSS